MEKSFVIANGKQIETQLPCSLEEFLLRQNQLPRSVVVEHNGEPVAFAATSRYRPRECYSGIAEVSLYVARDSRRRGAGRLALSALIEAAKAAGLSASHAAE